MIYLDNAATSFPKPREVSQAVSRTIESYGANPGRGSHSMSIAAAQIVYKCREEAADLFNIDSPENIIFTLNTTHAINTDLPKRVKYWF